MRSVSDAFFFAIDFRFVSLARRRPLLSLTFPLRRSAFYWVNVRYNGGYRLLPCSSSLTLFREFQRFNEGFCVWVSAKKDAGATPRRLSLFLQTYTHTHTHTLLRYWIWSLPTLLFFDNNARSFLLSDNKRCAGEKFGSFVFWTKAFMLLFISTC